MRKTPYIRVGGVRKAYCNLHSCLPVQYRIMYTLVHTKSIHLACSKSEVPLTTLKLHSCACTFKETAKRISCTLRYVIFRIRRDFDLCRAEEYSLAGSRAVKVIAFSRMAAQSSCVYFRLFNLPKQQSISLVLLAEESLQCPEAAASSNRTPWMHLSRCAWCDAS